jgi:hypothetical protein
LFLRCLTYEKKFHCEGQAKGVQKERMKLFRPRDFWERTSRARNCYYLPCSTWKLLHGVASRDMTGNDSGRRRSAGLRGAVNVRVMMSKRHSRGGISSVKFRSTQNGSRYRQRINSPTQKEPSPTTIRNAHLSLGIWTDHRLR